MAAPRHASGSEKTDEPEKPNLKLSNLF